MLQVARAMKQFIQKDQYSELFLSDQLGHILNVSV